MDIAFLLKGLILGFSIAAPVGPIGVLCIRRTLASGFPSGILSGLGAATADAFYGGVAAFGLTFVSTFLVGGQIWLRVVGGLFLLYLGLRIFLSPPPEKPASASTRGLAGAFASTFFLTLTNPATIISFAAVFAGFGLGASGGSTADASLLVVGVFAGSALWWLLLASGVTLLRSRLDYRRMGWINKLSGAIIIVFGLITLASLYSWSNS
ncbi:MAG TPA: LysE family transporter [Chloroflexia bacterium]|nr:LysE family transporter [Chloroflexia bacterium]